MMGGASCGTAAVEATGAIIGPRVPGLLGQDVGLEADEVVLDEVGIAHMPSIGDIRVGG